MGKVIGPVDSVPPPERGGGGFKYEEWYQMALDHIGKFIGYEAEDNKAAKQATNAGYQFGRSNGYAVSTRVRENVAYLRLEKL